MDRRIVLVTGASRGIGRAAAIALAEADNHVVCIARSEAALTKLDDELREKTGREATLVPMDLKDGDGIDRLGAALDAKFGRIDGLFANAGVLGTIGPLSHVTPSSFSETMTVNLDANWRLIRALDPLLRKSPAGRALFVTSGAAIRPRAYWGPYAASKAALEALVTCYADEMENTSVRVNLFDPGATRTQMRFKAMPGEDQNTLPTPDEVASVVPSLLEAEMDEHSRRFAYRTMKAEG